MVTFVLNINLELDFWNEEMFLSRDTISGWSYAGENFCYYDEFPVFSIGKIFH